MIEINGNQAWHLANKKFYVIFLLLERGYYPNMGLCGGFLMNVIHF